jgi:soluble lytic murein transglycosylase
LSLLVFLLLFSLCFNSCAQEQNDFYRGVLSRAEAQSRNAQNSEAVKHFEKALNSPNAYIRQAAAEELANMMYEGVKLSAKTFEKVKKEAVGSWAAAFAAVEKGADRKKTLAFLLGFDSASASVSNEARLYTLRECEKNTVFNETELAAIEGHFSSSRGRYNEALIFFRAFQEEGEWPAQLPALFVQYPGLINDLGRTFQYTSSGNEGFALFLQWEKNLTTEAVAPASPAVAPDKAGDLRFRLLFYSARIARRIGRSDQAVSLFEQARPLALETEQADACVWYILDSSLSENADVFLRRLEQFIPHWYSASYFNDVMEKFLQVLVSKKDGERLIRTHVLLRERGDAVSKAAYAWVIARFIQEGYFSAAQMRLAALALNPVTAGTAAATELDASVFMRIAYNAWDTSFYYHSLSAAALGEPFFAPPPSAAKDGKASSASKPTPAGKATPAVQFLLGFFDNGASAHSVRYIRSLEKELSTEELRAVAQGLSKAGMYAQSMRIVSLYNKNGHVPERQDFELMFPRPFKELVEKYAAEAGVAPALLYGLIRTESAFQSGIVSRSGAIGLTQLLPSTALEMAGRIRRAGGSDYASGENGIELDDPAVNIHIGSYYLNYLIGRFDDTLLSLLAYNGGMNRIRRWRAANKLPADLFMETITIPETRDYGRKVMGAAAVYEELYYR